MNSQCLTMIDIYGHVPTLEVIPPVASPAGESGKPLGGGHLRVALFAFALTGAP